MVHDPPARILQRLRTYRTENRALMADRKLSRWAADNVRGLANE